MEDSNDMYAYENRKICFKMAEMLFQHGADINWFIDKKKGYTILMQLAGTKETLNPRPLKRKIEINF
jgi:hypothetical protein